MSERTKLLLVALAAVLLLAGGILLGHLLSSTSDAEREAWESRSDSLLGEAMKRHRAVTDSLGRLADSLEAAARAEAERAELERKDRAASARVAANLARATDSLQGALAAARSAGDSTPVLTALVGSIGRERDQARADARRDSTAAVLWESAYRSQLAVAATLRRQRVEDSTRITVLEGQLQGRPKADRWKVEFLGLEFRPCVFTGVDVHGRTTTGAGTCATP